MNILVINCGSSSLKYQLLDMTDKSAVAMGLIERIGEDMGSVTQKSHPDTGQEQKFGGKLPIPDHAEAMRLVLDKLVDPEWGVIKDLNEIDAIGHRVVQGGEDIIEPVLVDQDVIEAIRKNIPLGPLHNPAHLAGIEGAMKLLPGIPNVVVVDTEFHQTMPKKAYLYPVPMELYTELKVRKYGFHGTSHKYVTKAAAAYLGKPVDQVNLITAHLGNGCSMAAVKKGKCVDTSMGLTPLAGLMMGTRCGNIDPAVLPFVAEHKGVSLTEIDTMLNKKSGLLGICGMNDMRDIHAARESGDESAQLAFEMFAYRVKTTIGAYLAVVGEIDALIFTAGIGENDSFAREEACAGLEHLGIKIDSEKNNARLPGVRNISAKDSRVAVLIVPTDEELEIAQATMAIVDK